MKKTRVQKSHATVPLSGGCEDNGRETFACDQ